MNSTRLVETFLEFECNAMVLADVLNLGSEEVVFLPHNDHLLISNFAGTYTTFKLMTKECFSSYKLNLDVKEEWLDDFNVEHLKPIVVSRGGIVDLLKKIQGTVKITIEEPADGEERYISIQDTMKGDTNYSGNFKMKERELIEERLLARFVQFFDDDNMMIPKSLIDDAEEFHLLKTKEGVKFSPMIISGDYKQFMTSIANLDKKNKDVFDIKVFNSSSESNYEVHYKYIFIESTNEEKLIKSKNHEKTLYKFPANPKNMELVLKFQSAHPEYFVIIEDDDEDVPFTIFFCSVKDMGEDGKVYTSSMLFLESEIEKRDIKVLVEE